jgi:hypothetical protein
VAVAAVGAATTLLTSGHAVGGFGAPPATPGKASTAPSSSATAAGPLTVTQARSVLATYTQVNNGANAQRSDTLLATVETGSSYAIDTGVYRTRQAAGVAPYPGFRPAQATYFIPRDEPVNGPRWFAVRVANVFLSNPRSVTSTEYLLFTQAVPGGPWRNAIEPYILPGASAARIAIGADGLATAVSPGAASVAVAPSQLPAATAGSLDGTGQAAVANLGNLADLSDQRLWQAKVPGGKVVDAHAPATGANGQEFALLTVGGGALVFYSDAAELTITPPAGSMLHLTVPGFYSSAQAQTQDRVSYLEQFAAYDPPVGDGVPRVVASYSSITGRN